MSHYREKRGPAIVGNSGSHHHHARPIRSARCLVVTVSDSRSLDNDEAGREVASCLAAHGHELVARRLVKDEIDAIRETVRIAVANHGVDAVILTGGTGIAPRDVTPEAVEPLFDRQLPGFGEIFRELSYREIGPAAILSRAVAGVVGSTLIFAIPGSPAACKTAVASLIGPVLGHAVDLRQGTLHDAEP